ncbi:ROK family protein [Curtobacterium sp. NPDC090217]|uniref:ROK family protein n=1 Tax=Curtobacterium sp. NPDC090217 TaxID=3363970 RepID=UPI003809C861
MTVLCIGIDIGGTKTAAGLVREDGTVFGRIEAATPARSGPAAVIGRAEELVQRLRQVADDTVEGVGVGAAGVIDPCSGRVSASTDLIAGWAGTDLRGDLEHRLRLPVTVINDVHAHAVAEARVGAGSGVGRMLLFGLGTGIGGALTQDGVVEMGRRGVAGHFGHMPCKEAVGETCSCGKAGHLEAVASGPAILRRYRRATGDRHVPDTRAVFARAAAGVRAAEEVVETASVAIGEAIGGMVNACDPERTVLSGGLAFAGAAWLEQIRDAARNTLLPHLEDCPVLLSPLNGDAAIIGAALHHRRPGGHRS